MITKLLVNALINKMLLKFVTMNPTAVTSTSINSYVHKIFRQIAKLLKRFQCT